MPVPTSRIYEYMTVDGTVFWSLTRLPETVSPPLRLVLQSKKGSLLGLFIAQLRNLVAFEKMENAETTESLE